MYHAVSGYATMILLARASFALLLGLGLLTGLTGCDNDEESPARLRAIHAVPAAEAIDIFIDFDLFTPSLRFRNASPYILWEPGLRRLEVRPADGTSAGTVAQDAVLDPDSTYTILATGTGRTSSLLILQDDRRPPSAGRVRLRIVHAASNIGAVNVALSEGDNAPAFDFTLDAYGDTSASTTVEAGMYTIETRLLDGSNPTSTLQPLDADRQYLIVVTATTVFAVGDG
jgi:hypothetical protein